MGFHISGFCHNNAESGRGKESQNARVSENTPRRRLADRFGEIFSCVDIGSFCIDTNPPVLFTIYQLGSPKGNVDVGATWGSYVGLLMLGACYTAIGMFASSITDNQIVAFVLSIFLCFFFYSAFAQISKFDFWVSLRPLVEWTGISYHYDSISRGVIDTRDIVYFLSFTAVFLGLTKYNFSGRA